MTDQPGPLCDKHGLELCEHLILYGASKAELEQLDGKQVAMLSHAGLLR